MKKHIRNFKNHQNISKHLYCPICHEVLRRPVLISCGHTFCKHCIQLWKVNHKQCPNCRQNIAKKDNLLKNLVPQQIIDELEVNCASQECEWSGQLQELEKHYKQCKFFGNMNQQDIQEDKAITIEEEVDDTSDVEILEVKNLKSSSINFLKCSPIGVKKAISKSGQSSNIPISKLKDIHRKKSYKANRYRKNSSSSQLSEDYHFLGELEEDEDDEEEDEGDYVIDTSSLENQEIQQLFNSSKADQNKKITLPIPTNQKKQHKIQIDDYFNSNDDDDDDDDDELDQGEEQNQKDGNDNKNNHINKKQGNTFESCNNDDKDEENSKDNSENVFSNKKEKIKLDKQNNNHQKIQIEQNKEVEEVEDDEDDEIVANYQNSRDSHNDKKIQSINSKEKRIQMEVEEEDEDEEEGGLVQRHEESEGKCSENKKNIKEVEQLSENENKINEQNKQFPSSFTHKLSVQPSSAFNLYNSSKLDNKDYSEDNFQNYLQKFHSSNSKDNTTFKNNDLQINGQTNSISIDLKDNINQISPIKHFSEYNNKLSDNISNLINNNELDINNDEEKEKQNEYIKENYINEKRMEIEFENELVQLVANNKQYQHIENDLINIEGSIEAKDQQNNDKYQSSLSHNINVQKEDNQDNIASLKQNSDEDQEVVGKKDKDQEDKDQEYEENVDQKVTDEEDEEDEEEEEESKCDRAVHSKEVNSNEKYQHHTDHLNSDFSHSNQIQIQNQNQISSQNQQPILQNDHQNEDQIQQKNDEQIQQKKKNPIIDILFGFWKN